MLNPSSTRVLLTDISPAESAQDSWVLAPTPSLLQFPQVVLSCTCWPSHPQISAWGMRGVWSPSRSQPGCGLAELEQGEWQDAWILWRVVNTVYKSSL